HHYNGFFIENDPLFSCIITLSILILVYFPHGFSLLFSPVLVLTASLLLSLLHLGATQRIQTEAIQKGSVVASVAELEEEEEEEEEEELKWATCKDDPDLIMQSFEERFVEWDVTVPLEVIYEEGDEEEGNDPNLNLDRTRGIEIRPYRFTIRNRIQIVHRRRRRLIFRLSENGFRRRRWVIDGKKKTEKV
ncbi:uncharacterized protein LOC120127053, partial [Hibiscus syriacus]|uniref:uncharacterized protein LOC120127053 n=1 Tax=Hibiscus syriacus TaxID=106335 RepID=UPI001922D5D9